MFVSDKLASSTKLLDLTVKKLVSTDAPTEPLILLFNTFHKYVSTCISNCSSFVMEKKQSL